MLLKIIGHEHMVEIGTIRIAGQQSVYIQVGDTYSWSFEPDTESRLATFHRNLPYFPSLNL